MASDEAGWRELGERVALARAAKNFSQAELSEDVGLDRTALNKIENGVRRVSALELGRLARSLGRSVSWFLTETPAPILSRRAGLVHEQPVSELAAELVLEDLVLDVRGLLELGVLGDIEVPVPDLGQISTMEEAEQAAQVVRDALGDPSGPLPAMAGVLGRLGLLVYTDHLDGPDGLAVRLDEGVGVCVISSASEPGRRRMTAAHELGHFVLDDAYSVEHLSASSGDEREQLIDAFAGAFLVPESVLYTQWLPRASSDGPRAAAVEIAAGYRVSWTALCNRLRRLGLVSAAQSRELDGTPVKAEFFACGLLPVPDLEGRSVPPLVGRAVMSAYQRDDLTASRVVELMRGTLDEVPRGRRSR